MTDFIALIIALFTFFFGDNIFSRIPGSKSKKTMVGLIIIFFLVVAYFSIKKVEKKRTLPEESTEEPNSTKLPKENTENNSLSITVKKPIKKPIPQSKDEDKMVSPLSSTTEIIEIQDSVSTNESNRSIEEKQSFHIVYNGDTISMSHRLNQCELTSILKANNVNMLSIKFEENIGEKKRGRYMLNNSYMDFSVGDFKGNHILIGPTGRLMSAGKVDDFIFESICEEIKKRINENK